MSRVLENLNFRCFCPIACNEPHLIPLLDEAASKDSVLRVLYQLKAKITARDLLIFYFAGHSIPHPTGVLALRTLTEAPSLTLVDLANFAAEVPCHVLIILDVCGGVTRSQGYTPKSIGVGQVVLAAKRDEKAAEVSAGAGKHGLFTSWFLKALEERSLHSSGRPADVTKLVNWVRDKMPPDQTPCVFPLSAPGDEIYFTLPSDGAPRLSGASSNVITCHVRIINLTGVPVERKVRATPTSTFQSLIQSLGQLPAYYVLKDREGFALLLENRVGDIFPGSNEVDFEVVEERPPVPAPQAPVVVLPAVASPPPVNTRGPAPAPPPPSPMPSGFTRCFKCGGSGAQAGHGTRQNCIACSGKGYLSGNVTGCFKCGGTGVHGGPHKAACHVCQGKGYLTGDVTQCFKCAGNGLHTGPNRGAPSNCYPCQGKGYLTGSVTRCFKCNGSGVLSGSHNPNCNACQGGGYLKGAFPKCVKCGGSGLSSLPRGGNSICGPCKGKGHL